MKLRKHARILYQPVLPLGSNGKLVTSSKEHWKVARDIADHPYTKGFLDHSCPPEYLRDALGRYENAPCPTLTRRSTPAAT